MQPLKYSFDLLHCMYRSNKVMVTFAPLFLVTRYIYALFYQVKEQKKVTYCIFNMCLKFPEITCRIGKITIKKPKNRQKIPLFFTTKYLQTIIYINNINIKLTYHMHKYVVIKMKKNASFKHQLPLKDLCILRLLMHDISVFAIKSH